MTHKEIVAIRARAVVRQKNACQSITRKRHEQIVQLCDALLAAYLEIDKLHSQTVMLQRYPNR